MNSFGEGDGMYAGSLTEDLTAALQQLAGPDIATGLELVAQVVLRSAEEAAGLGIDAPVVREAAPALLLALRDLLRRAAPPPQLGCRQRSEGHTLSPAACRRLADRGDVWEAVQRALGAAYCVDDQQLAVLVLAAWRKVAAELLLGAPPRLHGAAGGVLEGSSDDDEGADGPPGPAPGAAHAPGDALDELLRGGVARARQLAPLGGLALRVVELMQAFHTTCGVNPCDRLHAARGAAAHSRSHPDAEPLGLLVLWLHLLLHPAPQPEPAALQHEDEGQGGAGTARQRRRGAHGGPRRMSDGEAEAAMGAASAAVYPLVRAQLEGWVGRYTAEQEDIAAAAAADAAEAAVAKAAAAAESAAAGVGVERVDGSPAAAVQVAGGAGPGAHGGRDASAHGPEGAAAEAEVPSPAVLLFQTAMAVVQDPSCDTAAWNPAPLQRLLQQLFGLLGGGPDDYAAVMAAYLRAAAGALAAASSGPHSRSGRAATCGAAADAWSADPGVARLLGLVRCYEGLSLVVRGELARSGEEPQQVSRLLSLLTAMARPGCFKDDGQDGADAAGEAAGEDDLPECDSPDGAGGAQEGRAHGVAGSAAAGQQQHAPHPMCRLVGLVAELLLPESNCSVPTRVAALHALCSALDEHMAALEQRDTERRQRTQRGQRGGMSGHEEAAALWLPCGAAAGGAAGQQQQQQQPGSPLEALFFCLMHDPSIKVRRAAMRLLGLVVLPTGGDATARLVRTLLAKLRDKDVIVSDRALELLCQLPVSLVAGAAPGGTEGPEWTALVRTCVVGLGSGPEGGGGPGSKGHGGDRGDRCRQLLQAVVRHQAGVVLAAAQGEGAVAAGYGGLPKHPVAVLLEACGAWWGCDGPVVQQAGAASSCGPSDAGSGGVQVDKAAVLLHSVAGALADEGQS